MKTLYFDLFSGVSGDMFVGALIDLGVDFSILQAELARLHLDGFQLAASRKMQSGIAGTKFDVHLTQEHTHAEPAPSAPALSHLLAPNHHHPHGHGHHHDHPHEHKHAHPHPAHEHGRNFSDIRQMINNSPLPAWVKEKSLAVFQRVANAEGKIHGKPADQVHFHEVGAVDSIVDIVGACIALDLLGRPRILASPVIEGTGSVRCAHGRLPLPAPATLEILAARGVGITQCDEPHELVTPTGAALIAEFAESFTPLPQLVPSKIGYGLGTRTNVTRPNVLRVVLCEEKSAARYDWEHDTVCMLETNLDDVSSELLGYVMEKALASGALDVFHTPIQMKKNRPGVMLTILCECDAADRFTELLLTETTAFGVRRHQTERRKLSREIIEVNTLYGSIKVKLGRLNGSVVQAAPEYESCRSAALSANVSVKEVFDAARVAASPLLFTGRRAAAG